MLTFQFVNSSVRELAQIMLLLQRFKLLISDALDNQYEDKLVSEFKKSIKEIDEKAMYEDCYWHEYVDRILG